MIVIVASITAGVGVVAALIGAQARWDRREGRGQTPLYQPFAELPGCSYTTGRLSGDWSDGYGFPAPDSDQGGFSIGYRYEPRRNDGTGLPGTDERVAEFARDPDHAERITPRFAHKYGPDFSTPRMREPAVKLRDQMFPPGSQHYWVPNGEHPGQDGKWWVFLGATRTPWGYFDRDEAVTTAELQNRTEKRGKYAPPRR